MQDNATGAAIEFARKRKGYRRRNQLVSVLHEHGYSHWSVPKLANYELGRTDPTLRQARELAEILEVDVADLVYGIGGAAAVTRR